MKSIVEYINPAYQEILLHLSKWKVLSLSDLLIESDFRGSKDSFYKIIRKLESACMLDSFIDTWTKEKYLYLEIEGIKYLGLEGVPLIKREQRYHDALVVKISRYLNQFNFCKEVYLDTEIQKMMTRYDRIADASFVGIKEDNEFNMAIELELNQKSRDRIKKNFEFYSSSSHFNYALYVFYKSSTFNSYKKVVNELSEVARKRIILLLETKLTLNKFDLANSQIYFKGNTMKLHDILDFEKQKNDPMIFQHHSNKPMMTAT
jgi:hypothetical protein